MALSGRKHRRPDAGLGEPLRAAGTKRRRIVRVINSSAGVGTRIACPPVRADGVVANAARSAGTAASSQRSVPAPGCATASSRPRSPATRVVASMGVSRYHSVGAGAGAGAGGAGAGAAAQTGGPNGYAPLSSHVGAPATTVGAVASLKGISTSRFGPTPWAAAPGTLGDAPLHRAPPAAAVVARRTSDMDTSSDDESTAGWIGAARRINLEQDAAFRAVRCPERAPGDTAVATIPLPQRSRRRRSGRTKDVAME